MYIITFLHDLPFVSATMELNSTSVAMGFLVLSSFKLVLMLYGVACHHDKYYKANEKRIDKTSRKHFSLFSLFFKSPSATFSLYISVLISIHLSSSQV